MRDYTCPFISWHSEDLSYCRITDRECAIGSYADVECHVTMREVSWFEACLDELKLELVAEEK